MTLQQLRYIIKIATCGSIHNAAKELFITQPTLTKSIKDLETEMGITIFYRTNRGMNLTEEGIKFLSYAKQVVEQADLLEEQFKNVDKPKRIFAIASHHYAFVVNAFVELVKEINTDKYEFSLRELRTFEIIEEVKTRRSEIGILYLSNFNNEVLSRSMRDNDLVFNPLFTAKPHVFISKSHPLKDKKLIEFSDLEKFPFFTYDQGINNSFYFAEKPHSAHYSIKNVIVSDRATLFNLLIGLNGYTISSGILSRDLNGDNIISIPLNSDEIMQIGYICRKGEPLSNIGVRYIELLSEYIKNYKC